MKKKPAKPSPRRAREQRPAEITMTDLEAKRQEEAAPPDEAALPDTHAAGTPGGGTAVGGLAGSNRGDGAPDEDELDRAMGSGIHDADEDDESADPAVPYAGPSGGAVGGTPAQGR